MVRQGAADASDYSVLTTRTLVFILTIIFWQYKTIGEMKRAESLKEIIDHHFNGGNFQYDSYDHMKAESEFKTTDSFKQMDVNGVHMGSKIDKILIPETIRNKYAILKNGKLRSIDFAPDGNIRSIKLGNKRPVNFYKWSANKITLL